MRRLLILMIAGVLAIPIGCSEKATAPDQTAAYPAPETTELPAAAAELLDANTVTDLAAIPGDNWPWADNTPYDMARNCTVYAVTFVWGSFNAATTPPDANVTDWSGSAYVNAAGALHAHRTIDFETGEDYLLPVETNAPTKVAWVSKTSLDVDGLCLLMFVRNDVTYAVAPRLTFETGPVVLRYDLAQLADLKEFYVLDGGLAVAVLAHQIWPARCYGGFMEGRWLQQDLTAGSGRLEGLWLNYRGDTVGIMIGNYWTTETGEQLMDGWVSGYITDQIIAYLKGKWWYDDPRLCPMPWCGTGHGWFTGRFTYADGSNLKGVFSAEFGTFMNTATDVASLPYRGVWYTNCPWPHTDVGTELSTDLP